MRVAINGFGRIGRALLRALLESRRPNNLEIVAINEIAPTDQVCHLLKYDSVHGRLPFDVVLDSRDGRNILALAEHSIRLLQNAAIETLPWHELDIDLVVDCTGICTSQMLAEGHLKAGARRVLLSYPAVSEVDATIVFGVNHASLDSDVHVISNASCTSNCVIPVISVLNAAFGVSGGNSTTIHAAMSDQPINDSYSTGIHRTRAAMQSVIPITTGLARGIGRFFPHLSGKFESTALRVPTLNVSMIDLNLLLARRVTVAEAHAVLAQAAESKMDGIMRLSTEMLVSIDYNHDPHSVTIDATQTTLTDAKLLKLMLWFDNEWGFANRLLDTANIIAQL